MLREFSSRRVREFHVDVTNTWDEKIWDHQRLSKYDWFQTWLCLNMWYTYTHTHTYIYMNIYIYVCIYIYVYLIYIYYIQTYIYIILYIFVCIPSGNEFNEENDDSLLRLDFEVFP